MDPMPKRLRKRERTLHVPDVNSTCAKASAVPLIWVAACSRARHSSTHLLRSCAAHIPAAMYTAMNGFRQGARHALGLNVGLNVKLHVGLSLALG